MARPFVGAYGPSNAEEQWRPVPPPDWNAEQTRAWEQRRAQMITCDSTVPHAQHSWRKDANGYGTRWCPGVDASVDSARR